MVTDGFQGASIQKRWICKNFDADGYFLLQLANEFEEEGTWTKLGENVFLTADDASSLTIQGMYKSVRGRGAKAFKKERKYCRLKTKYSKLNTYFNLEVVKN
jgi:hypothetical protein